MTQPLFRQQAVQHQRRELHGDVLLSASVPSLLISGGLVLWCIAMAVWLGNSHYTRKETVLGWLEPPQGVLRVYANHGGIIHELFVTEGELVEADQPLAIIHGNNLLATGEGLESQLLQELTHQQELLREQKARNENRYTQRYNDSKQRINRIEQELQLLEQQTKTLEARKVLHDKQLQRHQQLLSSGHVSATDWENSQAQALALQAEQQALSRQSLQQQRLLDEARSDLQQLPQNHADQQTLLATEISERSQQMAQWQSQQAYVIKAARKGIVSNLRARVGQQVTSTQQTPLLTLQSEHRALNVQLLVPARAVGFVQPGQRLNIRYDAFPFQKFGIYGGTVTHLSDAVLLPGELQQVPIAVQEPMYLINAELDSDKVQAFGREFSLKSGMTVSADLRLEERSLIRWLLEPLYSLRGRL